MRVGILATGKIAHTMAHTISLTDGVTLEAVASRSHEKANAFAKEFDVKKAYGSYKELMEDKDVDLIYIATPHSEHKEIMLECISHKKNVLCEKAFTVNKAEAEEVFRYAKEMGVFVTEAIWTRYMPSRAIILEYANKIGPVTSITANLSYKISEVERIKKPELAGGALLDIGIYPINFALMAHEGEVDTISGLCTKNEYGVDIKDSISIRFKDGVMATLLADATTISDRKGIIYGENGYIEIKNINCPEEITVYACDRERVKLETCKIDLITGYEYELLACKAALEDKELECFEMPHSETLRVMELMDSLRALWGIKLCHE